MVEMSLINQVLNDLEKRGADAPLSGDMIRPVPSRERNNLALMLILGVIALLVMSGALKWYMGRAETSPLERSIATAMPMSGAGLALSSGVAAASAPVEAVLGAANLRGKPLLEVKSEEPPVLKKNVRRKPRRILNQQAETAEDLPGGSTMGSTMDRQLKKISPQQRAQNEFNKANQAVQEGRTNDALAAYEEVLRLDPSHQVARRALVGVLLGVKRNADAEHVLQDGLKRDPHEASFAMLLARLQVERDAVPLALETLLKSLPYAEGQADYQSFVAALLQRQSRHDEAIAHYQIALKLVPDNGVWLMGMGISLQAQQRTGEARDAYQRALSSNKLSAQLKTFVQNKLKEL
jgi:MSHA biogenesis protein MshN